ncbi:hypothetical protein BKA66DRAFT_573006 [Pyrenochaeta sp. MPI-SDFR-AT-0127]|nr:hypothetical protein BKA66DRAFT_573006 [Pyrenochaeta sp. MPI-SDFR-AT-0127]
MAVQQRKQSSLILTFKVLRFVNQLRRRVKPRVPEGSVAPVDLGTEIAPSHQSLGIISNELSRISTRDGKHARRVANGVCKSRKPNAKAFRRSLREHTPESHVSAAPNTPGDEVLHMLGAVDGKLSPAGSTLSSIASSDKLFLKHQPAPISEGCSLDQTVRLLVTVQEALNVLAECRSQYGDAWLLDQGLDVGLNIDESFIANYEHMLLRLRAELINALARKALEELLHGGHDKKQRKMLSWFTEFAEKPQPMSTSFPWTIKPSLAVLWGVCWMFYNSPPGEQAAKGGNDRVRQTKVLQHLDFPWNTPASSDYLRLGRSLIGSEPQRTMQQQTSDNLQVDLDNNLFQARNTEPWESVHSPTDFRLPSLGVSQAGADGPFKRAEHAAPQPFTGHGTYYAHAQQSFPIVSPNSPYSPQFQGTQPLAVFSHLASSPWHLYNSPLEDTRHQINPPQNPTIQITGTPGSQQFAQPHGDFVAPASIYSYPRQPQALQHNQNTSYRFAPPPYMMESALSPDNTTMQVPQVPIKHERTSSINSTTNILTPVSMSGPRSPLVSPTSGERTHLISSPHSHSHSHSRNHSVTSSEPDGDDDGSLRKSYKRAEEPPRNGDNKFTCIHQECNGLIFDRKCEWSKHMDKHDRPYKCLEKGCEKLQGFTYSGGLLRHEREVHKMHGGTKKSLFCPFHDCKRSSGAGFTRKENLAEHIRRVHRRTSMSADMHGLIIRRETLEASPATESRLASESPYNRTMEFREEDEMHLKRKRGSDAGMSDRGNAEMRDEIKRLKQENEEKDSRLRQLEQAVIALQQNRRLP